MTPRAVARGAREVAGAWAAAHAQLLFAASALSGLLFLAGLALLSPHAAAMAAVGALLATLGALGLGYPRLPWRNGLYGYAGALAGLYWGVLFEPDVATWSALLAAGVAAPALTRLIHRYLMPREIPTLALPALAFVWLAAPFLAAAAPPASPMPGAELVAWSLMLVGLAVHSRLLALGALVGVAAGLATSLFLAGAVEIGFVANSVPTAIALGAVYLPATRGSLLVAGLGAVAAGASWWGASLLASDWLPALVAPFNAVTVVTLALLRARARRSGSRWLPAPLPLESITTPERSRAAWTARRRLLDLVRRSRRISVLTGAGVSTEAGLPDVRSAFGLGQSERRITLEDFLASAEARTEYWRQEEDFFRLVERAAPAAAHHALAALHRQGRLSIVVTQNVDGLHGAAGIPAEVVTEVHGNVHRARCVDCGHEVPRATLSERIASGAGALYCDRCQGLLKGGGLLFGESVESARLDAALRALLDSDLLLILGTSLVVAPASDMLTWAYDAGIPIAIVNATPTPYDPLATVAVRADVGAVLQDAVR